MFYEGDKFGNFLFALLNTKIFMKMCLLQKEIICSQGEERKEFASNGRKLFPFRVDSFSEWKQNNFDRVYSPESVSFGNVCETNIVNKNHFRIHLSANRNIKSLKLWHSHTTAEKKKKTKKNVHVFLNCTILLQKKKCSNSDHICRHFFFKQNIDWNEVYM